MLRRDFIKLIDCFLGMTDMSPTMLGTLALEDPSFVLKLRRGREPREATQQKVIDFMRSYAAAHGIDFDVEGRSNA